MPRIGSSPLAFPDFRGATRRLILINLAAYFALLLASLAFSAAAAQVAGSLTFDPGAFLHGSLWQPLHLQLRASGLLGTLFELLSLWFLAGFLEGFHNANWVTSLYAVSVLGTAAAALALYVVAGTLAPSLLGNPTPLYGCFGGIFGLLAAIGLLYGDMQFLLFPLPIGIKARYLVMIYALVAVAMLFGQERMYAFAQLGGALAGLLFVRMAPRRGIFRSRSARAGTACAIATTAGSAAAPPANSRSTCAGRAAPSSSTARAAGSTKTPTTRNGGTEKAGSTGGAKGTEPSHAERGRIALKSLLK